MPDNDRYLVVKPTDYYALVQNKDAINKEMKTISRINRLYARIHDLRAKILYIQRLCSHPRAIKTHRADTGNWDRSQYRYWTELHCPDCDKRWSEEGSK